MCTRVLIGLSNFEPQTECLSTKEGATALGVIWKVSIEEMVIPDTGVINPFSVRLLNCQYR